MNILERGSFQASHLTSIQAEQNALLDSVCEQSKDWKSVASMMVGGGVYKLSKYALLSKVPGLGNALASGIALGFEVSGYRTASQALEGKGLSASKVFDKQAWWNDFVNFGTLKFLGRATQRTNFVLSNFAPSLGMMAGHHLAYALHLAAKPEGTIAQQFSHAFMTDLQMRGSLALFHGVTGNFIQTQEALLDIGMKARSRSLLEKSLLYSSETPLLLNAMRHDERVWTRNDKGQERRYVVFETTERTFLPRAQNIWVDFFLLRDPSERAWHRFQRSTFQQYFNYYADAFIQALEGKLDNLQTTIAGKALHPLIDKKGFENYLRKRNLQATDVSTLEVFLTDEGEVLAIEVHQLDGSYFYFDDLKDPTVQLSYLNLPPVGSVETQPVARLGQLALFDSKSMLGQTSLPPIDQLPPIPQKIQSIATRSTRWPEFLELGTPLVWDINLQGVPRAVRIMLSFFERMGISLSYMLHYFFKIFQ